MPWRHAGVVSAVSVSILLVFSLPSLAQAPELSKAVKELVRVQSPRIILTHVRIIDGTGGPAVEDQNIVIESGKITAIQKGADVPAADGTVLLDLHGYSVIPGIVGMHNHLFYIARPNLDSRRHFDDPVVVPQMTFSAPRMYLAGGVTTMRTTGSVETEQEISAQIKSGNVHIGLVWDGTRAHALIGMLMRRAGRELIGEVHWVTGFGVKDWQHLLPELERFSSSLASRLQETRGSIGARAPSMPELPTRMRRSASCPDWLAR